MDLPGNVFPVTHPLVEAARRHCEKLAGRAGEYPFGENTEVYKIGGKMFALFTLNRDPVLLGLKLPPELGAELRAVYPATVAPGYYTNKAHWNTVKLAGEPARDEVLELIDISCGLIRSALPRRIRDQLSDA
jgi:predicted DNA-binding protein (MmcQ/YjbR family)